MGAGIGFGVGVVMLKKAGWTVRAGTCSTCGREPNTRTARSRRRPQRRLFGKRSTRHLANLAGKPRPAVASEDAPLNADDLFQTAAPLAESVDRDQALAQDAASDRPQRSADGVCLLRTDRRRSFRGRPAGSRVAENHRPVPPAEALVRLDPSAGSLSAEFPGERTANSVVAGSDSDSGREPPRSSSLGAGETERNPLETRKIGKWPPSCGLGLSSCKPSTRRKLSRIGNPPDSRVADWPLAVLQYAA